MTPEQFAQAYLENEANISNILHSLHIYDMDLLHDTYIALYDHSQHAEILNFTNTFVSFYRARHKRRGTYESHYEPYTNTQLAALDIIDESDLEEREARGKKVDETVKLYRSMRHLSGERNHQRACRILNLYLQGLTEREIGQKLSIDHAVVHRYLQNSTEKMRLMHKKRANYKDKGHQELAI